MIPRRMGNLLLSVSADSTAPSANSSLIPLFKNRLVTR